MGIAAHTEQLVPWSLSKTEAGQTMMKASSLAPSLCAHCGAELWAGQFPKAACISANCTSATSHRSGELLHFPDSEQPDCLDFHTRSLVPSALNLGFQSFAELYLQRHPVPKTVCQVVFSRMQGVPGCCCCCCSILLSPVNLLFTSASYCSLVHIKKSQKEKRSVTRRRNSILSAWLRHGWLPPLSHPHQALTPTSPLSHPPPSWCNATHLQCSADSA